MISDIMTTEHAAKLPRARRANLVELARQIRCGALAAIYHAGSGHPGGALSAADILAYLFATDLTLSPDHPQRDRFVLSKGHACPALYAAAVQAGWCDVQELKSLRRIDSVLQGHPHVGATPWVETSTGSLGQGFSVAAGMALGLRFQRSDARVYVMLGDGEMQEGQVWEAALFGAHHQLTNLCAIVDYNKLQSDDDNENILGIAPLVDKWQAFGWNVQQCDGHDFAALDRVFTAAKNERQRPQVIIAHTVKGQGVSYMAGVPAWHGSVKMREEETRRALSEIGASEHEIESWLTPREVQA